VRGGVLKLRNARYRDDPRPPDEECPCEVCARCSRAFLHHLTKAGELTAAVLATLHNLRYFLDFMGELREAIESRRLDSWAQERATSRPDANRSEISAAPPT